MIISPDSLRKETVSLIRQIDTQIDEVKQQAQKMGVAPEKLQDSVGNWTMSPLLLAKAMAYSTLVQLQTKR